MTNEELVVIYQNGCTEALEELIKQNEKMVIKLSNKFYTNKSNTVDQADLLQEGYIGLMKAAEKYDLNNKGKVKFINYAVNWVYKKMYDCIMKASKIQEMSIHTKDEDGIELLDKLEDPQDYGELVEKSLYYQEVRRGIDEVMDQDLTMFERSIIKLYYGWDCEVMKVVDLSDVYDVEELVIINANKRALGKIRRSRWVRLEQKERRRERLRMS